MAKLSDVRLFLVDMDGTFYLGDTLLPGAKDFIATCRSRKTNFCFLTNNSSRSADAYLEKLAGLGVTISSREMFTSGEATCLYMAQNGYPRDILLIGTGSLAAEFEAAGFCLCTGAPPPAAVVLGFDTTLDYAKLTALCNAVRAGLPYIATHPDFNCPVPGGYMPDIGATIAYVQAATGRLPDVVIGKPNAGIAEAAALRFGVELSQICMIGDRLYTDIALGQCGVQTALVLSGEATRAELAESGLAPTWVFEDLAALVATWQAE